MKVHRPCPFVSCRHHLHVDVHETTRRVRGQEVQHATVTVLGGDIAHTCALDVVDEHPDGLSREEIAAVLRVSEERTRIAERAMERKLRGMDALADWRGHECARGEEVV